MPTHVGAYRAMTAAVCSCILRRRCASGTSFDVVMQPYATQASRGPCCATMPQPVLASPGSVSYTHLDVYKRQVMDRATGALEDRVFRDIAEYLRPGDLLVANETRVMPARLLGAKRGLSLIHI